MDFKVRHETHYANGRTQYNLPLEIGCFSVNSDGKFCDDNHQLRYLAMPDNLTNIQLDLNEGFNDYIHIHEDNEDGPTILLRWIISHEELLRKHFTDRNSHNSKIDFVLYRGVLTTLGSTLYETSEEWKMYVTKFRSVIYVMAVTKINSSKNQWIQDMGEKGERLATWGFKFEQYMTVDSLSSRPDTSVPVNENEKYYSVMKGKIDKYSFLFCAEIDGADPKHFTEHGHDPTSTLRYIELKTSRMTYTERQKRNFLRYKLLNIYLQSYFAAVPRVICGYRDDDGIVRNIVNYNVRDMPKMADGLWCRATCLNFCSYFLDHLKKCDLKDDPRVVYEISWKPGWDITFEEIPVGEYQLLPDWYIDRVKVI